MFSSASWPFVRFCCAKNSLMVRLGAMLGAVREWLGMLSTNSRVTDNKASFEMTDFFRYYTGQQEPKFSVELDRKVEMIIPMSV